MLKNPIDLPLSDRALNEPGESFLFMGRLSKEKGIEMFCQAVTDLGAKGIVLGDGYMREVLARKYDNIEFAGWVSGEKKEYYLQKAKALVFPSLWYEGAPLTIVEMLSRNIPCIVPDRCAASECIEHDKNGYIFKIGDLQSLKDFMKGMTEEVSRRMSRNIRENFKKDEYSEENHFVRLLEIYEDILNN